VTYDGDWRETFRPDIPSVARIYDYLLGGKDNYPVDRAVGESMIAQLPNVRLAVQWNRAFLRRVVRYLIREAGIRQIIDIGAGLPRRATRTRSRWRPARRRGSSTSTTIRSCWRTPAACCTASRAPR
jgi:hypothetical protein